MTVAYKQLHQQPRWYHHFDRLTDDSMPKYVCSPTLPFTVLLHTRARCSSCSASSSVAPFIVYYCAGRLQIHIATIVLEQLLQLDASYQLPVIELPE